MSDIRITVEMSKGAVCTIECRKVDYEQSATITIEPSHSADDKAGSLKMSTSDVQKIRRALDVILEEMEH